MKKLLLPIVALVLSFVAAKGQPVLTAANMNPIPKDAFYGHYIDTNVSKGAVGANVTWNFSAVTVMGMDTITYFACDSTPYCDTFPGSNIAYTDGYGSYTYLYAGSTRLSKLGNYYPGYSTPYIKTQEQMRFPLAFNGTFVDTFELYYTPTDKHSEIDSYRYDGYGTLILPTGTDTGVARIRVTTYSTDSSSFSGVTYSRYEYYMWYKPGFHNPIFGIGYDTAGSATGTPYVSGAAYWTRNYNPGLSVSEAKSKISALSIYPNPATDELHIRFDIQNATAAVITITDPVGRIVVTVNKTNLSAGVNNITLPVSDIPAGLYIVHLQSEAGSISQKVSINK